MFGLFRKKKEPPMTTEAPTAPAPTDPLASRVSSVEGLLLSFNSTLVETTLRAADTEHRLRAVEAHLEKSSSFKCCESPLRRDILGIEREREQRRCPDCGASPGASHSGGCPAIEASAKLVRADGPREITSHKVNECNEQLRIEVMDQPGSGGACHRYDITGFDTETNPSVISHGGYKASFSRAVILFQNGPIKESGVNGITNEALLAIVIDRLQGFQSGQYACDENAVALAHLMDAVEVLHSRTQRRVAAGVEGTHAPDPQPA